MIEANRYELRARTLDEVREALSKSHRQADTGTYHIAKPLQGLIKACEEASSNRDETIS